jgi:hypothetical protein
MRLEANESKLVSSYTYVISKKICEYERKKWIQTYVVVPPSDGVKHTPVKQVTKQPVHIEKSVVVPIPTPIHVEPQKIDLSALNIIVSKLENIVNTIQFQNVDRATTTVTNAQVKPNEPIFIPSKIMPDSADVRIKVATTESESTDFDSSLKILRGIKKT